MRAKVDYVFGVQGGAAVHLFDSCERIGPKPIYTHHEQAAAFAAVAYARVRGFGVCITTTGPAAVNAMTPCLGAFQDAIPVLFISGQSRSTKTIYWEPLGTRQCQSQEAPIIDYITPMTKYQAYVAGAPDLPELLDRAHGQAMDGWRGPVWIDLPVDQQWAEI